MSGKEFFTDRYSRLGWEYEDMEPRKAIRINSANAKAEDVVERLASRGVKLEKIPFVEDGFWVCRSKFSLGATVEYLLGLYSIQEAAAQIPARQFSGLEDRIVLDACSAPGGKTVQLSNLMQNTGVIVALDNDRRRLTALSNQLERCHVGNTVVYYMDARQASKTKMEFDRILLDVPCSGNFTTDKAWFGRRTIKDVQRNAQVQRQILTEAAQVLKDNGEIVYSTCSLEPEEDEINVAWAIENLNLHVEEINCAGKRGLTETFGEKLDNSIGNCRRIWPGQTQGFFVCRLRRKDRE